MVSPPAAPGRDPGIALAQVESVPGDNLSSPAVQWVAAVQRGDVVQHSGDEPSSHPGDAAPEADDSGQGPPPHLPGDYSHTEDERRDDHGGHSTTPGGEWNTLDANASERPMATLRAGERLSSDPPARIDDVAHGPVRLTDQHAEPAPARGLSARPPELVGPGRSDTAAR